MLDGTDEDGEVGGRHVSSSASLLGDPETDDYDVEPVPA